MSKSSKSYRVVFSRKYIRYSEIEVEAEDEDEADDIAEGLLDSNETAWGDFQLEGQYHESTEEA